MKMNGLLGHFGQGRVMNFNHHEHIQYTYLFLRKDIGTKTFR